MVTQRNKIYEVMAWKDSENPQVPSYREVWTNKNFARMDGQKQAQKYGLVEVNLLSVDPYDANNIEGASLVYSWTNGKKTA